MFLAQAHMALEEPREALEAAESAVNATAFLSQKDTPERANAYSLRASVLDRLGEVERAEQDYARASSDYLAALGSQHFLYLTNESLRGLALPIPLTFQSLSSWRSPDADLVFWVTALLAPYRSIKCARDVPEGR